MLRKFLGCLALLVAFFLPANHAQGHPALLVVKLAPRLAIQHSSSLFTAKQLALLLSKGHNQIFLTKSTVGGIPLLRGTLPGSLSARAILAQYRTIVQNGIALGSTASVTNGQLLGTLYFNSGGTTYNTVFAPDQPLTFAFGSNPLNVGGGPEFFFQDLPFVPNSISLTPGLIKSAGGFLGPILFSRRPPLFHLSGSQQAFLNQEKALTRESVLLGAKLTGNGGPITGGELSGEFYQNLGMNRYEPVGNFVYAFGSNPLNQELSKAVSIPNPSNFFDFTSGIDRSISSGVLFGTGYLPFNFHQGTIFALGNNPLNIPPFHDVFPTNFTSLLFF
jgi:hypothetical protein